MELSHQWPVTEKPPPDYRMTECRTTTIGEKYLPCCFGNFGKYSWLLWQLWLAALAGMGCQLTINTLNDSIILCAVITCSVLIVDITKGMTNRTFSWEFEVCISVGQALQESLKLGVSQNMVL